MNRGILGLRMGPYVPTPKLSLITQVSLRLAQHHYHTRRYRQQPKRPRMRLVHSSIWTTAVYAVSEVHLAAICFAQVPSKTPTHKTAKYGYLHGRCEQAFVINHSFNQQRKSFSPTSHMSHMSRDQWAFVLRTYIRSIFIMWNWFSRKKATSTPWPWTIQKRLPGSAEPCIRYYNSNCYNWYSS